MAPAKVLPVGRQVPQSPRQRFYLVEVLAGLGVTAGHFFRNMGLWLTGRKGAEAIIPLLNRTNTAEPAGLDETLVAYRYQGKTLLPARFLLNHFAISHKWEVSTSKTKILHLYN